MGRKSTHKKQQKKQQPTAAKQANRPAASAAPQGRELGSLSGATPAPAQAAEPKKGNLGLAETMDLVRSDIRRIVILLTTIAVVLAGLVIANAKSNAIKSAGRRFSSFLRLG